MNAQTLCEIFDEFKNFFQNGFYQVIAVSEIWLSSSITDNLVNLDNYRIFRRDRDRCRGGGVCIYVHKKFESSLVSFRTEVSHPGAEFLFVKIQSQHDCALIG